MSEYYLIETTVLTTGAVRQRTYDRRAQAMDAWDTAVEEAQPGERLRLVDVDAGRIMSEYTRAYPHRWQAKEQGE
jgi:hypothetical protein